MMWENSMKSHSVKKAEVGEEDISEARIVSFHAVC